jgi:hypothetical protein
VRSAKLKAVLQDSGDEMILAAMADCVPQENRPVRLDTPEFGKSGAISVGRIADRKFALYDALTLYEALGLYGALTDEESQPVGRRGAKIGHSLTMTNHHERLC